MEHKTYTIDAKGRSLGRVASEVAAILRGKNSASFQPNKMPENKVVIENINEIKLTGKKMEQKVYKSHSGYPGSLKKTKVKRVIEKKGMKHVFEEAVTGMLPDNRLRKEMLKNLTIK